MKSSLEDLLDVYNSPENDDGSQLMFLFSSNIMSESYTLKEVRHIWFMTIPDTFLNTTKFLDDLLENSLTPIFLNQLMYIF